MTSLAFTAANGKHLTMGEGRLKMISTNGLESPPLFIVTTAGPIESRTIALNPVNLARKIKANVLVDLL